MTLFALSLASRSGSGFCSGTINEYCLGLCAAGIAFLVAALVMCSKAPAGLVEGAAVPHED